MGRRRAQMNDPENLHGFVSHSGSFKIQRFLNNSPAFKSSRGMIIWSLFIISISYDLSRRLETTDPWVKLMIKSRERLFRYFYPSFFTCRF